MNYQIFGESHGPAIGIVIERVPAGISLDLDFMSTELARRAPGKNSLSTARNEADRPKFLSGVLERPDGSLVTTGAPLCLVMENTDTRSRDYESLRTLPRPSHSDYAAFVKYGGHHDIRGGGHFSGRLTAPLVAAGCIARQILGMQGIEVAAHVSCIGGIYDEKPDFAAPDMAALRAAAGKDIAVLSPEQGERMAEKIRKAKESGDSLGGSVTCFVTGVPAGTGGPDLEETVEGAVSRHLFSIPAVRGVVFGDGVEMAAMQGSEANDEFIYVNQKVQTKTNRSGGVNGGIANGMPLVFTAFFRPTPSIAKPQQSVNLQKLTAETLVIEGRHDPCIVPRAVAAVEAAAALAVYRLLEI